MHRSKTLAAWLALTVGLFGLHRIYLYGPRDRLAWLHPWPTLAGMLGVQRMLDLGQDDVWATMLIPLLGSMISLAMITGIVWALTPDERWDARHNPGQRTAGAGWGAVVAAVVGLLIGGAVLMGTIAFSIQRFFEWQLHPPQAAQTARHVMSSARLSLPALSGSSRLARSTAPASATTRRSA